jgi:hypothetical protein
MGKNLDTYNAFYEASWANPPASVFEANEKYLSGDFQTLDMEGNVQMNREAYLGLSSLLYASFPDFKSVIHDTQEDGDNVIVRRRRQRIGNLKEIKSPASRQWMTMAA